MWNQKHSAKRYGTNLLYANAWWCFVNPSVQPRPYWHWSNRVVEQEEEPANLQVGQPLERANLQVGQPQEPANLQVGQPPEPADLQSFGLCSTYYIWTVAWGVNPEC